MNYARLVTMLATAVFMAIFAGTGAADHTSSKVSLPPLKIISPSNGAIIENPVLVVFETAADVSKMTVDVMMKTGKMDKTKGGAHLHIDLDKRKIMPTTKVLTKVGANRYQCSLGNATPGRHVIRVYWADATHMKAMSKMATVNVTVK